jgi:heme exporter protein C
MKKLFSAIGILAVVALMIWGFYQAMYVAPTEATMGDVQRIFYYHVPNAMLCFLFFAISFVASILFLTWRRNKPALAQAADAWALAGAEVGVVFCSVVLITGPLWGKPVWGIWWTWDARLTTTLVLWLIYVSYLLLRKFAAGPQMQTLAAVLSIFGAMDVPIVYMANRWWRTQHPAPVFGGSDDSGIKDPTMLAAFGWNVLAWGVWGLMILAIRVYIERRQQRIDEASASAALAEDQQPTFIS